MTVPVLEARDLHKSYRNGAGDVDILRGVSLRVDAGTVVAVVGPSGSGKTTLLNLLSGLDVPTRGQVYVGGEPLGGFDADSGADFRRRHIGFVFQFFNLIPTMTARDNVAVPLLAEGRPRREIGPRATAALAAVGLAAQTLQRASRLSGGEMQRVAIARALVMGPRLVLADEPTGNLDSRTGDEILRLLCLPARETGRAVLMVTHSQRAAAYADRVLTMRDGRIVDEVLPGGDHEEVVAAGCG